MRRPLRLSAPALTRRALEIGASAQSSSSPSRRVRLQDPAADRTPGGIAWWPVRRRSKPRRASPETEAAGSCRNRGPRWLCCHVPTSDVSLDSIVYCFREGLSPESIAESFPTLTLEQVYGAIAFYLANQPIVDQYLREGERLSREMQVESRRRNAGLITRLQRVPHESQIPG